MVYVNELDIDTSVHVVYVNELDIDRSVHLKNVNVHVTKLCKKASQKHHGLAR